MWNLKHQTHDESKNGGLPRADSWGKWEDIGQRVYAFSTEINIF
jgi:hypothetical protein